MELIIKNALSDLTSSVNLATGIGHPNDENRAKKTFKLLHDHKVILLKPEIVAWCLANGWTEEYADELGSLAQQIGEGKNVKISGEWWVANIIEKWEGEEPKV